MTQSNSLLPPAAPAARDARPLAHLPGDIHIGVLNTVILLTSSWFIAQRAGRPRRAT